MLKSPVRFLRERPAILRALVLGYTALLCGFFFPPGSTPTLHRVILLGVMSLCLTEAYGPGKTPGIYVRVLAAAAAGLLGRHLLEYGEVSGTRNFTAANVLWFLSVIPPGITAAYHLLVKYLLSKPRIGGA